MRQQDEQSRNEHPESVRSAPVRVPPADDGGRAPEYHEPAPVPSAFGATTVGGAVAASAMAKERPSDERDPREDDTVRPGDGAVPERSTEETAARVNRDTGEAVASGAAGYGRAEPEMVDPDTTRPGVTALATTPQVVAPVLAEESAQELRNRWREVQLRFVDDPRGAAAAAREVVDDAVEAVSSALAARKDELGDGRDGGSADTERLRTVVRQHRDFLERLLSL